MKKFVALFLLLFLSLVLAACGGSVAEEAAPSGPGQITITVEGDDTFQFNPANISVATGSMVTIEFVNRGTLEHAWVLVSADADPLLVTEDDAIGTANSGTVQAAQTQTFRFIAPEPGEYLIVCPVPGHAAGGMVGTLTVTP